MPATSPHSTATENSSWDGGAATRRMPNEKSTLTYCHAWHESGAGDEKSGYKFPHHRTKGGPANLPACRNGLARLSSAHIPDSDRAGVERHLRSHLGKSADDHLEGLSMKLDRDQILNLLPRRQQTSWYEIKALGTSAEVRIYDEISMWGITAEDFVNEVEELDVDDISCRINCPGGSVFDGIAIYNALRQHRARVTTQVDSLAASIASVIAQAGDHRVMLRHAQMMIHNAHGISIGDADDMREMAEVLDRQNDVIASIYAEASPDEDQDEAFYRNLMSKTTFMTDSETVENGLADEVVTPTPAQQEEEEDEPEPDEEPEPVSNKQEPPDWGALFDDDDEELLV